MSVVMCGWSVRRFAGRCERDRMGQHRKFHFYPDARIGDHTVSD
jgi:hypothetical protein